MTLTKEYSPEADVLPFKATPVFTLVSVTDAPGMAAPEVSVVNPRNAPLPATCAARLAAHTIARMAPSANRKNVNLMVAFPSRNQDLLRPSTLPLRPTRK